MDGWLDLEAIRDILRLDSEALKKRIQRGKFTKIRQQKVTGKGARGGQIWQIHITDPAIPKEHREAWLNAQVETIENLPAITQEAQTDLPAVAGKADIPALATPAGLPAPTELKKYQRETMDARMFFIRLIEKAVDSGFTLKDALETVEKQAKNGELPPIAKRMMELANARRGEGRTLSVSGMKKWWGAWQRSGKNPVALAPEDSQKLTHQVLVDWVRDYQPGKANVVALAPGIPEWLPYFLDKYRDPQKPSRNEAIRRMKKYAPAYLDIPSKDQVSTIMKRIPLIYLEKGRMTGAEYRSLLGYAERDASMDNPLTVCQIDGHSFKAYVAHPTTGAHFHPEVCGVICLTTKAIVGYSAGLAESWRTVADAVRHACTVSEGKPIGGTLAVLEPDRGSGNLAKVNSDEVFGIFARLGITFLPTEEGGNPQERGAIERVNQSLWIRAAKSLVTYTGKDMDRGVKKRVYTKLEKDLKKVKDAGRLGLVDKTSELLMSWREFLVFLDEWVDEYNNTPHSALPRITAPPPGEPDGKPRRRHMTPTERYAQALSEGWRPTVYGEDMLNHLMMPHERVRVFREKFTLHGNSYHAYELCQWHSQEVIAAYDIHDAERVWVLDLEERPICVAKWNGNKRDARPVSVKEQAVINRENRRIANVEKKAELIRAESETQRKTIEVVAVREVPKDVIVFEEKQRQREVEAETARAGRRLFRNAHELAEDIERRQKAGEPVGDYESRWIVDYQKSAFGPRRIGLYLADPDCAGRFQEEQASATK